MIWILLPEYHRSRVRAASVLGYRNINILTIIEVDQSGIDSIRARSFKLVDAGPDARRIGEYGKSLTNVWPRKGELTFKSTLSNDSSQTIRQSIVFLLSR